MTGSRFPLLLLTLSLNLIFRDLHLGARGFQLVKVKVGNRRAARKFSARSRAASKTPVPTSGEEPRRRAPENNRAGIAVLQSISIPHQREPFATFTQRKKTSRENVSSLEGKEQEGKEQEGKKQEGKKQEEKKQEGKKQEGKEQEGKKQEGKKQEEKKQEGKKQEGKKQEGKKQEGKNSTSKQEQDEAYERLVQQELRKLQAEEAQKTTEKTQSETQDTPVSAGEGEAAAGNDEAGARCGRGCCLAWAVLGCCALAVAIIGGLVYCSLSTTSGGDGVMGSAYSMNSNGGEPVSFGEDLGTASRKSFQVVNPEAQHAESGKNDSAGGFRQEAGTGGWNPLSSGDGSKPAAGGGGAAKRGRAADKNAPRGRGGTGRSTSVGSARKKKNFWGS
eukprot:g9969.t1